MKNSEILLVEDDPNWQNILKDKICIALKGTDYQQNSIIVAKTFAEAYQLILEKRWNLLVTDIALNDSSISCHQKLGIQLVDLASRQDIPVVVVSGTPAVSTQDIRDLFKEHKAYDYLNKGAFDNKRFINIVKEILQKQQYINIGTSIKILFLASEPSDASRLRLGQELRDIREKLQLAKYRDRFVLEQRWSLRSTDISQAILDIAPTIVHFSGHGTDTGELFFEDNLGKLHPVQPDALAKLFALVDKQVYCVVLNACHSKTQAEAIAEYIPFVIGMNQAIGDQAAIAFAIGFYTALGANLSIEEAYNFGITQIQLQNIPEHLTPILYKNKNLANLLAR